MLLKLKKLLRFRSTHTFDRKIVPLALLFFNAYEPGTNDFFFKTSPYFLGFFEKSPQELGMIPKIRFVFQRVKIFQPSEHAKF